LSQEKIQELVVELENTKRENRELKEKLMISAELSACS
jgi:hypothetical protein